MTDPKDRPSGRVAIEKTVSYEKREDGWYVQPGVGEGFELFADGDADPQMVEQLIRKEYDDRY